LVGRGCVESCYRPAADRSGRAPSIMTFQPTVIVAPLRDRY
jgi:hypothetical protein